jgi:hypothetical protein
VKNKYKLYIVDAFELPTLPNFLRYKGNNDIVFPIDRLKDGEIKELARRFGIALIKRKRERSSQ